MAGHSKFKNIMHRKGAQDKKRASLFAKLAREIIVAVKVGGEDPTANNRLRLAITTARSNSMPKDNIERAIKRGTGNSESDNYMSIRYEGYGPYGVAVIVECLSNNRNRIASDIRAIFSKANGNLAENNAVAFMFDRVGQIEFAVDTANSETMFEAALEVGAIDIISDENIHEVICNDDQLHEVANALEQQFAPPNAARLIWKPNQEIIIIDDHQKATNLLKMIDALEEYDDVQNVFVNFDIADDILEQI